MLRSTFYPVLRECYCCRLCRKTFVGVVEFTLLFRDVSQTVKTSKYFKLNTVSALHKRACQISIKEGVSNVP